MGTQRLMGINQICEARNLFALDCSNMTTHSATNLSTNNITVFLNKL